RSPGALWAFVTAPETRWADRMAAAWRAFPADRRMAEEQRRTLLEAGLDVYGSAPAPRRFVLPTSWFPRVIAARRELARERALHHWGLREVTPHASRMAHMEFRRYEGERRRVVLGHVWMVPDSAQYESTSILEKVRDPWPAQVETVLDILYRGFRETAPPAEFFAAALRLPCQTDDDAYSLVLETRQYASGARTITPEVVGAWRNAALNPALPRIRDHVTSAFYTIGITRTDEAFWLGQALMEDMAARASDAELPMLVLHLGWMDTDERPGWEIVRPGTPDVATWALARRVHALPDSIAPYIRRRAAADVLVVADSAAGAKLPQAMQTDSTGNERAFADYRSWFVRNRDRLERQARAQAPQVEAARRAMARSRVCAGGTRS
ncbi:MAG TPA: hypothetical protein VEW03_12205, partial [Longimicrobiaceae bacterium]|nr:hypothetical protein [Longimicrobiaceae bacterium]